MTDAISEWMSHLFASSSPALGPSLLLGVCAVVLGLGCNHRASLPRWGAASIQVGALLAALIVLALQVQQRGWLVDVDYGVTQWLIAHRDTTADVIAVAVTDALGPVGTASAAALLAVLTVLRFRSFLSGLVVLVTVGGASLACTVLKLTMSRARPPIGVQETLETDYSFPSGHVTGAAALFGMIVVVTSLAGSPRLARCCAGLAAVAVVAVAASRLYLGVHWLTDVVAGAVVAAAAVAVGAAALDGLVDRAPFDSRGAHDEECAISVRAAGRHLPHSAGNRSGSVGQARESSEPSLPGRRLRRAATDVGRVGV